MAGPMAGKKGIDFQRLKAGLDDFRAAHQREI
jgi:hypothetical protein